MSHENNNNKYHPDHQRRCCGCYKIIKTKEGILTNQAEFACVSCHNWYKKFEAILISLVILLAILAACLALKNIVTIFKN